jgi:hypothetical protein
MNADWGPLIYFADIEKHFSEAFQKMRDRS